MAASHSSHENIYVHCVWWGGGGGGGGRETGHWLITSVRESHTEGAVTLCLTDGVKRQLDSTCTCFHLLKKVSMTDGWSSSSDDPNDYTFTSVRNPSQNFQRAIQRLSSNTAHSNKI
jgi:hypothetical protein